MKSRPKSSSSANASPKRNLKHAKTRLDVLLVERGQVKLDEPVQTYIPEFTGNGKEAITIKQLLLHLSGLRGDIYYR